MKNLNNFGYKEKKNIEVNVNTKDEKKFTPENLKPKIDSNLINKEKLKIQEKKLMLKKKELTKQTKLDLFRPKSKTPTKDKINKEKIDESDDSNSYKTAELLSLTKKKLDDLTPLKEKQNEIYIEIQKTEEIKSLLKA